MATATQFQNGDLATIGVDIGKDVFHLVRFDGKGEVVVRWKIRRLSLTNVLKKLPRCIVGMEACLSTHFVSRTLRQLGFEPRIVSARYTRPFAKGRKNDYNSAGEIAEAALWPNLKLVSAKSQDKLDLQALHRLRYRLVSRGTATINQIRAFLIEQGLPCAPEPTPCASRRVPSRRGWRACYPEARSPVRARRSARTPSEP
jgi:transposase